jgi:hypothetical protein
MIQLSLPEREADSSWMTAHPSATRRIQEKVVEG